MTELGVDRIVPLLCERTVVRPGEGAMGGRLERLRRIIRESAMQARLVHLPELAPLLTPAEAAESDEQVALAEPGGEPVSLARPTVLVGPEGGWSPSELGRGLPTVTLGEHVLRVETAAVTAAALLTGLRAGIVRPVGP
jgi:16S rRNA (uracil1498-N3)-methyltransferase